MGEAPDLREIDCPTGEACDWSCDIHDPIHLNWMNAWPHAVAFTRGLRMTDDPNAVTCSSCRTAMYAAPEIRGIRDAEPTTNTKEKNDD